MKATTKREKIQNWTNRFRIDHESAIMRELGYCSALTSDRRAFDSLLSKVQKAKGIKLSRMGKLLFFGV